MDDKALKRKPIVCIVSSIIIALEIQEKTNENKMDNEYIFLR